MLRAVPGEGQEESPCDSLGEVRLSSEHHPDRAGGARHSKLTSNTAPRTHLKGMVLNMGKEGGGGCWKLCPPRGQRRRRDMGAGEPEPPGKAGVTARLGGQEAEIKRLLHLWLS